MLDNKTLDHILIIGAGEFGISTALALIHRETFAETKITILDSAPVLPSPWGSSVDSSRIIRADYAHKPYSALASQAQVYWRDQSDSGWGGQNRYAETGFVLTADRDSEHYVTEALSNVKAVANEGLPLEISKIEELDGQEAIRAATGLEGVSGDRGYANWNSGWADAEKVVTFALDRLRAEGGDRVTVRTGCRVQKLLLQDGRCMGAIIKDGEEVVVADQTILAAGAWSPSLIDLEGRCVATGQVLAYLDISAEEQARLGGGPVVMNFSKGTFIIPPREQELKVARHGFGYRNLQTVEFVDGTTKEVSVPRTGIQIPLEGERVCREALRELLPSMGDRPFKNTRICWYCDT